MTRGFQQAIDVLDGLLVELQAAGALRAGLHPQAVRSALMGAFEGLLRDQLLAERSDFPAHYDGVELRAVFRAVLEGVLVRP